MILVEGENMGVFTEDFIKENYVKLGLSKRFITLSEIMEIKEENNLNESILIDEVDKANDIFINSQKTIVLKEFKQILSSHKKFIDENERSKIRKKFYTRYYNFYMELKFDDYIDKKNEKYISLKKKMILDKFNSILSNRFIDDSTVNFLKLKLKEDNFDFNDGLNIDKFIDELNYKFFDSEKIRIFNDFDSFLSSCNEFITYETYLNIKFKYSDDNFDFFEKLNFKDKIIEKNKILICDRLNSYFSSDEKIINDDIQFELKSQLNTKFYRFYDEMGLNEKINEHNKKLKPKIIREFFLSVDGYISDSKRLELKSRDQSVIDWDSYIGCYNEAYLNEIASLNSDSFKYNNVDGKIDVRRTCRDVYYLHPYIQQYRWNYPNLNKNDVRNSKLLMRYKDGYDDAVDKFTRDLMKAIVYISNYKLSDEIKYLALVAIPPSDKCENVNSSMRKSINHIKMLYDQKRLPKDYDYGKIICDYSNLLYRFFSVPKSRSRYRVPLEKHVDTILCTKKNFFKENMVFILMDDITTQGTIMYACECILMYYGVKKENIYKLAIAETELV